MTRTDEYLFGTQNKFSPPDALESKLYSPYLGYISAYDFISNYGDDSYYIEDDVVDQNTQELYPNI